MSPTPDFELGLWNARSLGVLGAGAWRFQEVVLARIVGSFHSSLRML